MRRRLDLLQVHTQKDQVTMMKSSIRRTSKLWGGLLASAAAISLLASCSSGGSGGSESEGSGGDCEQRYTIAFSHPAGDVSFVKALKNVVEQKAEENGCVDLLLDNTVQNNLDTQRAAVETWINQKVDAIVVWPVDGEAFESLREQAQAQGTKWLTYAAPNPEEDGGTGFDNETAGKEMTEMLKAWVEENYPDKNITATVTTATALPAVQPRVLPVIDYLNEAGIEIVSQQDCITPDCGMQITEDVLRQHENLRIFVGLNDDAALGAQRALLNAGMDMDGFFLAGFDGPAEALQSLLDETGYTVTAAIDTEKLAASIIDNAIAAITGEGDASLMTQMVLLTPEDREQLEQLLSVLE